MSSSSARRFAVLTSVFAVAGACVILSLQRNVAPPFIHSSSLLAARPESQLPLQSGIEIRVSGPEEGNPTITRVQLPAEVPAEIRDTSEYLRGYAAAVSFHRSTAVP